MTDNDTPRERLVRVEEGLKHVVVKVDDIHTKVEQMHSAYLEGRGTVRGVRWVTYVIAAAVGYIATYLPKIQTLFSGLPK